MSRYELCGPLLLLLILALGSLEEASRIEELRNTPPELTSADEEVSQADASQAQARFLPFAASFSLNAGGNGAQTISAAGSSGGISFSQSASHSDPGSYSASQSLSSAASSHHGDVVNGQAISGASAHSHASSTAAVHQNYVRPVWSSVPPSYASGRPGNYYHDSKLTPTLSIAVSDGERNRLNEYPCGGCYQVPDYRSRPDYCNYYTGWYRDPRCRTPKVSVSKPGHSAGDTRQNHGSNDRGGFSQASSSSSSAIVAFPGPTNYNHQNIPREFVRSSRPKTRKAAKKEAEEQNKGPIEELFTDLSDTVYDILDY